MIQVKSVEIKRFRGIREGIVRGFADVNLLVGRNNSGKSTVVEAIHRSAYSLDANAADPLGRSVQVWLAARGESQTHPPELWYTLDQTESVDIAVVVGKPELDKDERITLAMRLEGNRLIVDPQFRYRGTVGLRHDEVTQFFTRASVFRPEDARNSNIERALWQKIIGPRQDKALTAACNTIFGQKAESYTLLPDGKLWLLFPDYSVPVDSQGEGHRAALRCLILLTVLRRTMLIAEEVECHQHPGSLTEFAAAICKLAKEQEVQLFLPTHSAGCVRAFLAASKAAGTESAVFHLKLNNGVLDPTRLDAETAETLLDTGVDVRFLDLYG